MQNINTIFTACLSIIICMLLAGCSSSSTSTSSQTNNSELKDTGKSAWNAVSFAMNVANPTYYAKKGAKYGYEKIKDNNEE